MNNLKEKCALEALKYIKDQSIVGLGGGSTIAYLVEFLAKKNLDIKIVTPSYQTAMLCVKHQLCVVPTWSVDHVDIAFGAIHTKEKIIASMADDYVLLVDESKVFEKLPFDHAITIEIIPESIKYVQKRLEKLGAIVSMRQSKAKDGYTISDHGMFIMEAKFKNVEDIQELDNNLKKITGIVDTSLFVGKVNFVLSIDDDGYIRKF